MLNIERCESLIYNDILTNDMGYCVKLLRNFCNNNLNVQHALSYKQK